MCTNHGYESNLVKIDEEERAEEKRFLLYYSNELIHINILLAPSLPHFSILYNLVLLKYR